MSKPEGLRLDLTPATFPCSSGLWERLGPKAGSFLPVPNWETFQAEPDEAREPGRSWSRRLLTKHFSINNSNPLHSFADFMTCKAVSYSVFLLILSTESTAAIIIFYK